MIEYPSIINSSKAPRQPMIAFEKFDGSNIRVKYSAKNGFTMFGSRTRIFDESHPHLASVIPIFREQFEKPLTEIFKREFPNQRDIIVFGEYFGANSFAGIHKLDEPHEFVMFDVMLLNNRQGSFLLPKEFIKTFGEKVRITPVVYEGNLTDQFIEDVRQNKYPVNEGVVCKGVAKRGDFRGKVWMCKIKTQAYFDKLKARFGQEWEKHI